MVRIAGLPDFSKFVRRVDRLQVYNSVHFVMGETIMEVNGCIICQKSDILEDLVCGQGEIYLDQFVGEEDGIQDCIELLYGGDIVFNNTNIKTIMKFSAIYQVHDMLQLCMDWINDNISDVNLFNMITLGLLIKIVGHGNHDLLDLCKNFIMEHVKDNISKLSESWSFANNYNFVRFLIQDEILYFTLPILTSWICNDSGIRLILEQAEVNDLTQGLLKHGSRTTELIAKMSNKMELFETSRKILKLQMSISMEEIACCSKDVTPTNKDLSILLSENYQSFSAEKILCLEEEYGLESFEFVEIAVNWIVTNAPSQENVMILWSNVKQLDYGYLVHVRNTILSTHNTSYTIPEIEELEFSDYLYFGDVWEDQDLGDISDGLGRSKLYSLLNNEPVVLKMECRKCNTESNVNLRLADKSPCYVLDEDSHCMVKHWYIMWWRVDDWCHYSLITNNYNAVVDTIKACLETDDKLDLWCLYKCRDEEQTHHTSKDKNQTHDINSEEEQTHVTNRVEEQSHHMQQNKKWWHLRKKKERQT